MLLATGSGSEGGDQVVPEQIEGLRQRQALQAQQDQPRHRIGSAAPGHPAALLEGVAEARRPGSQVPAGVHGGVGEGSISTDPGGSRDSVPIIVRACCELSCKRSCERAAQPPVIAKNSRFIVSIRALVCSCR